MYDKLKFSFGHIIAFLALLGITYVIFNSVAYYTQGHYLVAGIVAIGIMFLLLFLLLRLQLLKGADERYESKIKHERATLALLTLACIASFVVFSHFWTVRSREDNIKALFAQATQTSRQLIDNYDKYCNDRIDRYSTIVDSIYFSSESITHNVLKKGLRLQLFHPQYQTLKADIFDWLNKTDGSFSVWNVFLIGNIENVTLGMHSWNDMMENMSRHKMSDEPSNQTHFSNRFELDASINKLNEVRKIYSAISFPVPLAWIAGLSFLLLYLPWLIQKRNNASMVNIMDKRKVERPTGPDNRLKINNNTNIKIIHHGNSIEDTSNIEVNHRTQQKGSQNNRRRPMKLDIDDND